MVKNSRKWFTFGVVGSGASTLQNVITGRKFRSGKDQWGVGKVEAAARAQLASLHTRQMIVVVDGSSGHRQHRTDHGGRRQSLRHRQMQGARPAIQGGRAGGRHTGTTVVGARIDDGGQTTHVRLFH